MSIRKARLERQVKQKSLIRFALLAAVALLALGIMYQLTVNAHAAISRIVRDIELVEYGCLEDKLVGRAIVINHEEMVLAQNEGRFENMVKEGEKVSKGALLGYYVDAQGKSALRAQLSGIYVSQTDGLEETFRTMSLQEVTSEVFNYKTSRAAGDRPIAAGQAIYKIVDSLQVTRLLIQFPGDKADFEISDQQTAKVLLAGKDLGKAVVTAIKQDSENIFVIMDCSSFREELLGQRYVELEVVFNSYSGYLIPEKALVEREGKKGIYCSNGEDITFKPVKIIKIKDDIVVVEGLNINDLLVKNPPNQGNSG